MTDDLLRQSDLFQGLGAESVQRLLSIGRTQSVSEGEYLFLLGDNADRLYLVAAGKVNLCFPMRVGEKVQDVSVEVVAPGQTLGWSALVKPYRFTLSARAAEPSQVVAFARQDLLKFFDGEPRIGYMVLTRISELVGIRLLKVQALWVRELQRFLAGENARGKE